MKETNCYLKRPLSVTSALQGLQMCHSFSTFQSMYHEGTHTNKPCIKTHFDPVYNGFSTVEEMQKIIRADSFMEPKIFDFVARKSLL